MPKFFPLEGMVKFFKKFWILLLIEKKTVAHKKNLSRGLFGSVKQLEQKEVCDAVVFCGATSGVRHRNYSEG